MGDQINFLMIAKVKLMKQQNIITAGVALIAGLLFFACGPSGSKSNDTTARLYFQGYFSPI